MNWKPLSIKCILSSSKTENIFPHTVFKMNSAPATAGTCHWKGHTVKLICKNQTTVFKGKFPVYQDKGFTVCWEVLLSCAKLA